MSPERTEIPASEAAAPPQRPTLTTKQLTGIIGVLALAAFVMILNETVLSVALPGIMADLSVSAATGQWLTTGFLLTMSVVIPMTGFLIQRFQHRSLFMFAVLSFLVGTLFAVFAPNFSFVLIARVIQAIGTAIILPLLMTTTLSLVPIHKRGTVMGLNSIVIGVGPAIGPTVSGLIVHAWGWKYIFVLMVPLAVIMLVLGAIFMKVPSASRKVPLDIASVILSALAFGFLVYGISTIENAAENAVIMVISFVIGLISLVLFIRRQTRLSSEGRELLNLSLFNSRLFTFAILIIMITFGTMLGSVTIMPIILESGRGIDSLTIGLLLLPGGLAQAIVSPIFGNIFDKFGPRPVIIPGTIMLAAGQWLYVSLDVTSALWVVVLSHVIFSIGVALLMTGLMSSAMSSVEPRNFGHGSAIFNTAQQLGGAVGTTVMVTVMTLLAEEQLTQGSGIAEAFFSGAHVAFIIGACLATIAVLLSPFIKISARD
ncbi:DHA2 family efflux MFS transporter permease subunit [Glutamicibacter sp. NPDC087344]|uniref:DHA2 family efflux MFS transporter permease subunit n=1 Tax=Glutamicibacter sp. NPDC087344 TaxID=3363994 RepID=UPI00380BF2FB